jgi:glutamate-1-semialdehyde 2,1-aminomutase
MSAGLATLELLQEPDVYANLESTSAKLAHGLASAAESDGVPLVVNRVGSMLCPFFVKDAGKPVRNYADATSCDTARFARFFHAMLDNGVYLPPSQFEAWFVSTAHDDDAIQNTLEAARKSFRAAMIS